MTALDKVPQNNNFLSPLGFRFYVKKLPNVNFFVQRVKIPGISINPASQPTPFVPIPQSGDHISYNELVVDFKVDEDLRNYLEIHMWLKGLGFPDDFQEYVDLANVPASLLGEGIKTDVSLIILDSAKNPNYELTFMSAFPVSLSDIVLDSAVQNVEYVEATAAFRYTSYGIQRIKAA